MRKAFDIVWWLCRTDTCKTYLDDQKQSKIPRSNKVSGCVLLLYHCCNRGTLAVTYAGGKCMRIMMQRHIVCIWPCTSKWMLLLFVKAILLRFLAWWGTVDGVARSENLFATIAQWPEGNIPAVHLIASSEKHNWLFGFSDFVHLAWSSSRRLQIVEMLTRQYAAVRKPAMRECSVGITKLHHTIINHYLL
jgi:hypothetical protein